MLIKQINQKAEKCSIGNGKEVIDFDVRWSINKILGSDSYKIYKNFKRVTYYPRRTVQKSIELGEFTKIGTISSDNLDEIKPFFDLKGKSGEEIQHMLNSANNFVISNFREIFLLCEKLGTMHILQEPQTLKFNTFAELASSSCLSEFFEEFKIDNIEDRIEFLKEICWTIK